MSDLLILTAAELEARALARRLRRSDRVGGGVRVAALGPGAPGVGARLPALLAGLRAPLVVSAGVCGALDPRLRRGDLVVPRAVLRPGETPVPVDAASHARLVGRVPGAAGGLLVSVDAALTTPSAKAALRAQTGAQAADMESAAILEAAAGAGCPALVVRAVSDAAGEGIPAALVPLLAADGRVSVGRALRLAARPHVLPRAAVLGRATARALAAVAAALAALGR